jgi:acyl-CoA dehydrogenase
MIRCHPYAYGQIEALEQGDVNKFDTLLFKHIGHVSRNAFRATLLGLSRGHLHRRKGARSIAEYERKLAWASAKFAYMSDVALGLMGADLKRRESISGRFADILAQMYMLTATLKRFQEDGERPEDVLLLKVAMNNGFSKIDESFLGIYENLAGGFLGSIFKIRGFFSKLNPLGSVLKDSDLHKIAQDVGEDESLRNRLCFNIYKGGRVSELSRATIAMQKAKEAFVKVKKEGLTSLSEAEKALIKKAKLWQANIVEVDSFTKEEYFHKQTILEEA